MLLPFSRVTVFFAMKGMGKEDHKGGRLASDDKLMKSGLPWLAWGTLPLVVCDIVVSVLKKSGLGNWRSPCLASPARAEGGDRHAPTLDVGYKFCWCF